MRCKRESLENWNARDGALYRFAGSRAVFGRKKLVPPYLDGREVFGLVEHIFRSRTRCFSRIAIQNDFPARRFHRHDSFYQKCKIPQKI